MARLVDSISALETLQTEIDLVVDEMTQMGIYSVCFFDVKVPRSKGHKYVGVVTPPDQFPYKKTNKCETQGLGYKVSAELEHCSISTYLWHNERDLLLSTPLEIRKKVIEDFEPQLEEYSSSDDTWYVTSGAIMNIRRNLEKIKKSVEGENPIVEIHGSGLKTRMDKGFEITRNETLLTYIEKTFRRYIDLAEGKIERLDVEKCKYVSIGGWTHEINPVGVWTTPTYFPFVHANRLFVDTIKYFGFEKLGLQSLGPQVWTDKIRIFTDVPFRRRKLLLRLNSELKERIINVYENEMMKMSLKRQQELLKEHPEFRKTRAFMDQLRDSLLEIP